MRHRAWDLKPAQTQRVHERFLYLGWDLREKRGKHVTLYYSDGFEGAYGSVTVLCILLI